MHRILLLSVLLAGPAAALVQPSPFPTEPVRCTYKGFFAPGTAVVQWTYQTKGNGTSQVTLERDTVIGLLKLYLPGQIHSVSEWSLVRTETTNGALLDVQDQLVAQVELADIGLVTFTNTTNSQLNCIGSPRDRQIGEQWQCTVRTTDGWDWKGTGGAQQSGGYPPTTTQLAYVYLRNEQFKLPGYGPIDAAVVEETTSDGRVRRWHDPKHPWCQLQEQRLFTENDAVKGTDRLIDRQLHVPATVQQPDQDSDKPPPPSSDSKTSPWFMGLIAVLGLLLGIGLGQYHKKKIT